MDEIIKIWDIIVKSNTFNFAILVIIFAIAASKLNLGEKIEHIKSEIIKSIENAKSEKENAVKFLQKAQSDVANLDMKDSIKLNFRLKTQHVKLWKRQVKKPQDMKPEFYVRLKQKKKQQRPRFQSKQQRLPLNWQKNISSKRLTIIRNFMQSS